MEDIRQQKETVPFREPLLFSYEGFMKKYKELKHVSERS